MESSKTRVYVGPCETNSFTVVITLKNSARGLSRTEIRDFRSYFTRGNNSDKQCACLVMEKDS